MLLVREGGKFLSVVFADKTVVVPAFLKSALNKITGNNEFAIGEIEGFLSDEGKVRLVTEFVEAGLLRITKI